MSRVDDVQNAVSQPPLALVHGTRDLTVPYREAKKIQARAKRIGLPCELITVPGGGHVPMQELLSTYMDTLMDFVEQHLGAVEPEVVEAPGRLRCAPLPFERAPLAYYEEGVVVQAA